MIKMKGQVQTTDEPYAIELYFEFGGMMSNGTKFIYGDGQDVAMISCNIVDKNGLLVPDASNKIYFTIDNGPGFVLGVGNGDPACHEPDHGTSRSAFMGRARVLVQSYLNTKGTITLTAKADSLLSKSINIPVLPPKDGPIVII